MKRLILALENDPAWAGLLRDTLQAEGFIVRTFASAETMLTFTSSHPPVRSRRTTVPCLFLLDIELAEMNGLDLCRKMRRSPRWSQVPIILVNERTSVADRVAGLELADDYICKPFSLRELLARVHAVLRRCTKQQLPAQFAVGDLELDEISGTVVVRGRDVRVTAQEFRLLAYLLKDVGRVFSRDELLNAVWDRRFVTTRSVDVYMRRLREKIELQPSNPCYLVTRRGAGYRLAPPSQRETALREAANPLRLPAVPQYPQGIAA